MKQQQQIAMVFFMLILLGGLTYFLVKRQQEQDKKDAEKLANAPGAKPPKTPVKTASNSDPFHVPDVFQYNSEDITLGDMIEATVDFTAPQVIIDNSAPGGSGDSLLGYVYNVTDINGKSFIQGNTVGKVYDIIYSKGNDPDYAIIATDNHDNTYLKCSFKYVEPNGVANTQPADSNNNGSILTKYLGF